MGMTLLDRAKELAQTRDEAATDAAIKAKRARQDARCGPIMAELESLTGQTVRWGGGYASLDAMRQYGECVLCITPYERYEVRDMVRWRKGKNVVTKWSFTPVGERALQVSWENGLQEYAEEAAALEDVARKIGAMLCSPPWEDASMTA